MGLRRGLPWVRIVLCTFLLAMQGCGGEGGADSLPPTAAFTATPQTGLASLVVDFDAGTSGDPDGTIASYGWVFGDGDSGTGATVRHTYSTAGTYPITLTVTDDDGATDTAQFAITVTAPPNLPPTAAFTATPQTGLASL
ncbi:MAG: PKD domain-containing protein, partial [Deferrisomatales bacterium]|nr:PKD domain-containing protein [Deferrisomatales bacterium]